MSETILHQDILQYIQDFPFNSNGETLVVIHQANCFNTLHRARGIAGILGNAYPDIAYADDTTIKGDESKLGTYTYAQVEHKVYIFNVYGQYGYGRQKSIVYTQEEFLMQGLRDARAKALTYGPCVFLLPLYIGAGLANGNHPSIKKGMEEIFKDDEVIFIYN